MLARVIAFVARWRWWLTAGAVIASAGSALLAYLDFRDFQERALLDAMDAVGDAKDFANLRAQQWTSEFAYGALLFTAFGTAISAAGLWALIWTFREQRRLNHVQSRAYVVVPEIKIRTLPGTVMTLHIQPVVRNVGSTPTQNARAQIGLYRREIPPEATFDYPDPASPPQRISIGPGEEIILDGPTIAESDVKTIAYRDDPRTAKLYILVYGWIEYDDVFSGHGHRTEFCWELVVNYATGFHYTLRNWGPHNGIDGECMKTPDGLIVHVPATS